MEYMESMMQSQYDAQNQLIMELDETRMERDQLKAERDALAAQVEILKNAGNEVYDELQQWALTESHKETDKAFRLWLKARKQSPQQHLAEIRAEAIESLLPKCVFSDDHKVKIITESMIKNHAAKLRQGAE